MQVTVNGELKELTEGISIDGLLQHFNIKTAMVAVEHNRKILNKEELPSTIVKEGDKIEIISFVGGG